MHMTAHTHYQAELDAGRFRLQQCGDCSRHIFPPRELCPHCGAGALRWTPARGTGSVYSTSTIARKPDAGGSYNVALIDLDEGVRMMGRVEGVAPESVAIGQRVHAYVGSKDGRGLVLFAPLREAQQQPTAAAGGAA